MVLINIVHLLCQSLSLQEMKGSLTIFRIICTYQSLGFQLEIALDPQIKPAERLAARTQIHVGLSNLSSSGDRWLNAKWACRTFEDVIKRSGLSLTLEEENMQYSPGRAAWCSAGNHTFGMNDHNGSQGDPEGIHGNWLEGLLTDNLLNGMDEGLFNVIGF